MAKQDKRMQQTLGEASIGLLLETAQDKYRVMLSKLMGCEMILGIVADCIEKDDMQGLKNIHGKIQEFAKREG